MKELDVISEGAKEESVQKFVDVMAVMEFSMYFSLKASFHQDTRLCFSGQES